MKPHPQPCLREPSFRATDLLFHSVEHTLAGRTLQRRATAILKTLLETLREIFDENAYARFLARHGMTTGREAYAQFLRESKSTRERQPRCC